MPELVGGKAFAPSVRRAAQPLRVHFARRGQGGYAAAFSFPSEALWAALVSGAGAYRGALSWAFGRALRAGSKVLYSFRADPCVLFSVTLTKWLQPTRLETRTKESDECASLWVASPQAQ